MVPGVATSVLNRLAGVAAAGWSYAAVAAADARRHATALDTGATPRGTPLVSVIVPARNEAAAIGTTLDDLGTLDWPELEVLPVDDESTDGTWIAMEAAAGRHSRVRPLRGRPLPDGWVGKQWAMHQGVEAASGSWLLFSDADMRHRPASLRAALARAEEVGGGGVTVAPLVETGSIGERLLQGAAFICIGSFYAPSFLVRNPRVPVAIAAGGYILVRREAYEAVGGHAALRSRMLDDVALAEALKRAGTPLHIAGAGGLVSVRMYASLADATRGWRKNAAHGIRGNRLGSFAAGVLLSLAALTPPAATLVGLRRRDPGLTARGALGWAAVAAARLGTNDLLPAPRRDAVLTPLGLAGLGLITVRSALDRATGGAVWRGRRYPEAR